MISREVKKSILVPVIFFSWFKFPLTLKELRRYLWRTELSEEQLNNALKEIPGVHYQGGWIWRGELWGGRSSQANLAIQLWSIVDRWRWLFANVPFITQVYVSNTLAYDNANANSDIDLFLVARSGRLWTARLFLLIWLNLFKLRVRSAQKFGKFSPEFFVSESALDLSALAIEHDYYLSYWLADLVPIWPDGEHRRLRLANSWVGKDLPIAWRSPKMKTYPYLRPSQFCIIIEKLLGGKWGDRLETEAYYRQKKIIDKNTKRLGINPSVITTRDIIKLHFNDRRALVRDAIEGVLNEPARKTK